MLRKREQYFQGMINSRLDLQTSPCGPLSYYRKKEENSKSTSQQHELLLTIHGILVNGLLEDQSPVSKRKNVQAVEKCVPTVET